MVKLPSSQDIQRRTPQFGRNITSIDTSTAGRGLQQAGNALFSYGEKMAQDDKKLEAAYKKNQYISKQADWLNEAQSRNDYENFESEFNKWNEQALAELSTPNTPLHAQLQSYGIQGLESVRNLAQKKKVDYTRGSLDNNTQSFINSLPTLTSEQRRIQAQSLKEAYNSATDAYSYETRQQKQREIDNSLAVFNLQEAAISNPRKVLNSLSGKTQTVTPPSGFDAVFEQVWLPLEGGYNPSDPVTGLPVNYGVDQKANPDIDVANLTKEEAAQVMKERYWDRYDMDSVPAENQAVVFQALGLRPSLGVKMAKAAKEGASNSELLRMQAEELASLGGPVQEGWRNRIQETAIISGTVSEFGDDILNITPIQREKLIASTIPSIVSTATMFERAELFEQYPEYTTIIAQEAKKVDEALAKDPVAYVSKLPSVQKAQADFAANPTDEDAQMNFVIAQRDAQKAMGVKDSAIRYIPKSEAQEMIRLFESESTTPDQMLQEIDMFNAKYGPVVNAAVNDLTDFGFKGPSRVLIDMPSGSYRAELAQAYKMGDDLDKAIPAETKDGVKINTEIQLNLDSEIEEYAEAMRSVPNGASVIADYREGVEMLSKYYMANKGMDVKDAVEEAVKGVLPYEVAGTLILPQGTDGQSVLFMAEEQMAALTEYDIVAPAALQGDIAASLNYREAALKEAIPFHSNGEVVFLGPDGFPLMDADIAEYNEYGEVTNSDEAIISFPVSEALEFVETYQAEASPESIGNLRTEIIANDSVDVKNYYKPTSSINGIDYIENAAAMPAIGRFTGKAITEQSFSDLSDEDKAVAREAINRNIEYNKQVISTLDNDSQQAFRKLLIKSQDASAQLIALRKEYNDIRLKTKPFTKTDRQIELEREINRIKNDSGAIVGLGVQYLSMPEWAK